MGDRAEMRGHPSIPGIVVPEACDRWMASESAGNKDPQGFQPGQSRSAKRRTKPWSPALILGSPAEEGRFGDGARCRVSNLRPTVSR